VGFRFFAVERDPVNRLPGTGAVYLRRLLYVAAGFDTGGKFSVYVVVVLQLRLLLGCF